MTQDSALLEVRDLTKEFPLSARGAGGAGRVVHSVDGVTFAIESGTTFSLVGESGCGKTTTGKLILGLEQPTAGSIRMGGREVGKLTRSELHRHRRSVQAVFQDPYGSLNPRMRVGEIVAEPVRIFDRMRGRELAVRVGELLEQVGLRPEMAKLYPHQFSGGQRQRVALARALSLRPKLIVLDEPVSALDVSIRAQVLNLLVDLQNQFDLSYLLISHDLAIVEHMSHRIAVMYAGRIVEMGDREDIYRRPQHPYTRALLAAIPAPDPDVPLKHVLPGEPANAADLPAGCRFHPRCPLFDPAMCAAAEPHLEQLTPTHAVACFKAA